MQKGFSRILRTIALATVVLSLALPQMAGARKPGDTGKAKRSGDTDLSVISRMFTTTNSIIFGLDNRGNLGKDPGGSSTTGGGFWRARTDQYVFQSGLHVAGIFDSDGDGIFQDTVETEAVYDEEWREGRASNSQDDPANRLYSSTVAADLAAWPAEFCDENGEPKVYGQQDIVTFYTDIGGPVNPAAGAYRLGVETFQRVKLFSVTSQKDIMYVEWRFRNATEYVNEDVNGDGSVDVAGPYLIKDMLAGVNTDFDIGEATDDRAGVSPKFNMSIYWDSDFSEANFTNPVGFFSIKFLDSPTQVGRPPDGIDNDGNGSVDEEGEANRIGLTGFTITTNRGGPREDPNTDAEAYRIMINAPGEVTEPQWDPNADLIISDFQDDLRARLLTGPFDLPADGKFQKVEVAYFLSEPLRNPPNVDDITFEGELKPLIGLAQTVQNTFDTNFNLPAPPVSPNMRLIERDGSIVVTWDDIAERTPDPFYPVSQIPTNPDGTPAATYNPDYLQYDFQGYRVYRSLTSDSKNAVLVAQFDKADGVTTSSASYVTQQGADVNGDGVPDFPSTTFDPFDAGFKGDDDVKDTGLKYLFVDQGQGLSNRTGLFNGVRYYYSVTAFDYQPTNTGQESLESGLQLISLDNNGNNTREGIPRTSANGYIPASVQGTSQIYPDGSEIDEAGTINLDASGMLEAGAVQPAATNGLSINNITIANGDPSLLPKNLYFVVDSVVNTPEDFDPAMGFYHDAQWDAHIHIEDGSHSVIGSTMISTMGKYDPWGVSVELEGSIPVKVNGNIVAGIDFSLWADEWNGFVCQPIQVAGRMAYENIRHGRQRTEITNYFFYNYGFLSYAYDYGDMEMEAMSMLANARNIGHIYAGTRTADIEVKWVDAGGGDLTLEVYDLSNKVPVRFNQLPNDGWGFVPKDRTALDIQIDHQTAHEMFDVFFGSVNSGADLIAQEVTLADGSKKPYAVDDGIRRNLYLVSKLSQAIKPSDFDEAGREITDPESGEVIDEMGDRVADFTGTQDLDLYVCGIMFQINGITTPPAAGDVWKIRMRQGVGATQNPFRGGSSFPGAFEYGHRKPVAGSRWLVSLKPDTLNLAARDLKRIKVVPNPYVASSPLDLTTSDVELHFTNLPGDCTIRIYTVAGHLVDIIEHNDGTGDAIWNIRSRFNQKIASGYYIYHVEDHETGLKHMGKFAIIH